VLKADFPQAPICLAGDSLFACGRAIQIAKDNGWSYVYTFKPGPLPAVWADLQALLELAPENTSAPREGQPPGAPRTHPWEDPMELFGSLKRIARRLLECFRCFRLPDEACLVGTAIRIRLDTS